MLRTVEAEASLESGGSAVVRYRETLDRLTEFALQSRAASRILAALAAVQTSRHGAVSNPRAPARARRTLPLRLTAMV
jgi:hypothetical protein